MIDRSPLIVIAGGGTGGHVIPAIALAEEIARRGGTARFVGTRDRLEAKLVPKAGFEIDFIDVKPLVAGGVVKTLRGLASVPLAMLAAFRLLGKLRPDAVVGVGGYVAGPVVLSARIMGVPTALLEQNAAVGLTNRILAKWVSRAFVAFEETASAFGSDTAKVTGNPVKRAILDAARDRRAAVRRDASNPPVRILVMGGSQGARAIDERVPRALAKARFESAVRVVHQCSPGGEAAVRAAYGSSGIDAAVMPFIDDTAAAYGACDLVIARSGATTVSELTAMGLPAVFIPYPHHKDRQQARNAEPLARAGAAIVLDEKTATDGALAAAIESFVNDRERREKSAEASFALGRRDAAERIADDLLALARKTR